MIAVSIVYLMIKRKQAMKKQQSSKRGMELKRKKDK